MGCNAFYCLDTFNSETGATFLLPFSHRVSKIPSTEFVEKYSIQINAAPGSVILFDSMLFHRAGYNTSQQVRRGINHVYTKAIIRQQIDFPDLLGGRYSEDKFLNMLLGYGSPSVKSVEDFRTRRWNKIGSK
ncbi:phytanoyl-CoA dioxygenase family protein [Dyadobacter helix]|uniref:phytanoyl-CoA dioxygenase family protein n=1 Tax=Dyadobacter helix TaxID=2822344 RepID=UPI002105A9B7|nr:phytanoyl-CoA dioxygenase family protein [Dyadobacter sp. CECT 9275]